MHLRRNFAVLFFTLAGIAGPALATTITSTTYTGSPTSWLGNVTGPVDVFGSIQNNQSYSTSSGVSLSNSSNPSSVFVFTGPDLTGWNLTTKLFVAGGNSYPSLYGPSDGIGNVTVTMPAGGENAVLLDLGTSEGTALTVKLSDGEIFTPAAGLFGLSISHDITWLTVSTTSGSQPVIYDFAYGASTLTQDQLMQDPAPSIEAGTLLMIGGGLLVLAAGRRKLFS